MKEKRMVIYCTVNGWDCPYWEKDGRCKLGVSAIDECDDFAVFWNPNEEFWDWEEVEIEETFFRHAPKYVNNSGVGPS